MFGKQHITAAVLGLTLGIGSAQAQDSITLNLATGIAPTIPTGWIFKEYLPPRLEEHSDGRINPEVTINGALCSEHKCVEQAQLGQIDMGSVSGGNIGAFGSTFDILNLPYIFKDDESADELLNGWLGEELKKRAEEEMGLHIVAIIPSLGFRNVDNSVREIRVPSDMEGIKFRVTKTPITFNLIKGWGGTPVPYDWGQLYEGLQTGVVEGMYIPDAYVAGRSFYEVAPYITQTGGSLNTHILIMDKDRYDSLPDWAREAIDKTGAELQADAFEIDIEWREKATEELEGNVQIYTPTEEEMELWYEGAPPAWAAVKENYDAELARRALEDQGMDSLISALEEAGAL